MNLYFIVIFEIDKSIYFVENVEIHNEIFNNAACLPKLKNGDSVYITAFVDVHNVFVQKVDDNTDEFCNFIKKVDLFCSAGIHCNLFKLNIEILNIMLHDYTFI